MPRCFEGTRLALPYANSCRIRHPVSRSRGLIAGPSFCLLCCSFVRPGIRMSRRFSQHFFPAEFMTDSSERVDRQAAPAARQGPIAEPVTATAVSESDNSACVTIELTGPLERIVGRREVAVPSDAEDSLGRVMAELVRHHPDTAAYLADPQELGRNDGGFPAGFLVIRDGQAIPPRLETPVAAGQRLTLMPMISGG